ncbi:resolvase [Thermosynechococcus sp.]|uniref:resolvase n=1 Tax=Thermosynechococcus sp. TaxID=2814275 RepID=UPI00260E9429|nr:resolvase [Thermosynechococcus sp.]
MTIEQVQQTLRRSRASIYRYVNTSHETINPPFDPQRLNPEHRQSRRQPLLFHPNEVARFARDVMGMTTLQVELKTIPPNPTDDLLQEILGELKHIREILERLEK